MAPILEQIVRRHPGTVWEARARALKGLDLKFRREWDAALAEFDRVGELRPPLRLQHDVLASKGCILVARGRLDEAQAIFEGILAETGDWDQKKYARSWVAEIKRRRGAAKYTLLNSCGPQALAQALKLLGTPQDEARIAAAFPKESQQTLQVSLAELNDAARVLGVAAEAVRSQELLLSAQNLPAIALLKPGHFVVVASSGESRVKVFDPERGWAEWTSAEFKAAWEGYALVFPRAGASGDLPPADRREIETRFGGGCPCCPQGGLGDTPGGEDWDPDGPICEPGMPSVKLNTINLNWIVEDVDLRYQPLVGPAIEFKRAFNNNSAAEGAFGRGWTHSYNVSVVEFPGQAQVNTESGRIDTYVDIGEGRFAPPRGVQDSLTRHPDGTYTLERWKERLRYEFSTDGTLRRIVDRNDQAVTLEYDDNTPVVHGQYGPGADPLRSPMAAAEDSQGNVFVADRLGHRVVRFSPSGTSLVFGGFGSAPGQFKYPVDVAIDAADRVYVADSYNNRVQVFDAAGTFLAAWTAEGTATGPFVSPQGVAVDELGQVYVTDATLVRKFDPAGTLLTSWGGYGTQNGRFRNPLGIATRGGIVYVADSSNHRVQKFDPNGVFLQKWGSYGSADGQFSYPAGVAVDEQGRPFVADKSNHRVQQFDAGGVHLLSFGTAGAEPGQFSSPQRLSFSAAGSLLVGDAGNSRIQRFDVSATPPAVLGILSMVATGLGEFNQPSGLAVDAAGAWYVSDTLHHRVQKFDPAAGTWRAWGASGTGAGQFNRPRGLAVDATAGVVYVADSFNSRIQKFALDGTFLLVWSLGAGAYPEGVAVDQEGNVYVAESALDRIVKFDASGAQLAMFGTRGSGDGQFMTPLGIAVDAEGSIYVTDTNARVQKFAQTPAIQFEKQWMVPWPNHLAVDAQGLLYMSTASDKPIRKYNAEGDLMGWWGQIGTGAGEFDHPLGLAVNEAGVVIVADGYNSRLQAFDRNKPLGEVLSDIRDATGAATHLGYGPWLRPETLVDPQGHTAVFEYDANGYLRKSTDMEQVQASFTYDPVDGGDGDLASIQVPAGNYAFTYNHAQWGMSMVNPAGERTIFDGMDNRIYVMDPASKVTYYYSTLQGATDRKVDPAGGVTQYGYAEEGGYRDSETDPEGHTRSWTQDERGRVTSRTEADGRTTTWSYDDENHQTTLIPPAPFQGQTTVYQYDERENLLGVRDAELGESTFSYYPDGRLHTARTAMLKTTTYAYDDVQRTTTITDPLGTSTLLTHDEMGRLLSRRDPMNRVTTYEFDGLGRRIREVHLDGTDRTWDHTCCGARTETDELDRVLRYAADAAGRPWKVVNEADPANPVTLQEFHYDTAGRRDWMKDARGRMTQYSFDDRGWLTGVLHPDQESASFAYDGAHTMTSRTDRAGRTTTLVSDAAGRLTDASCPGGPSRHLEYDEQGRMTLTAQGGASVGLAYTPAGRVETTTVTLFGATKVFRYHYRADGLRDWWRDESSEGMKTTTYGYDDNGRLESITDPEGLAYGFEYFDDGALRTKTYPNGMYAEYEYDSERGWLTALRHRESAGGIRAQFVFKDVEDAAWYDAVGNRTEADVTGGEHHAYTYERSDLDRLLNVDRPGTAADEDYTYDDMGNRLSTPSQAQWAYNPLNDQLEGHGGVTYTYDDNGNRQTRTDAAGTTTYAYDCENRLVRVDLPGGGWATYDYDALGRRVRRIVDGEVTLLWYVDDDVVLETDASGVALARYTHGPGIDAPLKVQRGGAAHYYHEDALGSIVLMTDASGAASRTYTYDAFGSVTAQTGSVANAYQYTGREWDAESALYYYRARHYDPKVGRFLQTDPIGPRPEEMNAYVYARNNPVRFKDPYGLITVVDYGSPGATGDCPDMSPARFHAYKFSYFGNSGDPPIECPTYPSQPQPPAITSCKCLCFYWEGGREIKIWGTCRLGSWI